MEHLDHDGAVERRLSRDEDRAHPAASELAIHYETWPKGRLQLRMKRVGHTPSCDACGVSQYLADHPSHA